MVQAIYRLDMVLIGYSLCGDPCQWLLISPRLLLWPQLQCTRTCSMQPVQPANLHMNTASTLPDMIKNAAVGAENVTRVISWLDTS